MPSKCFVTGCKTGYRANPSKGIGMFTPPRDDELFRVWQWKIPRTDRKLTRANRVCELHFEKHLVMRDYVHVIKGQEVRIPRIKKVLAKRAIPTVFPNVPEYSSSSHPATEVKTRKRPRDRKEVVSAPAKKRKRTRATAPNTVSPDPCDASSVGESYGDPGFWEYLRSFSVPDCWGRTVSSDGGTVVLTCCAADQIERQPSGSSILQVCWRERCGGTPVLKVRNREVSGCDELLRNYESDADALSSLLDELRNLEFCPGLDVAEVTNLAASSVIATQSLNAISIEGGRVYSAECSGLSLVLCDKCRSLQSQYFGRDGRKRTKQSRVLFL